MIITTNFLIFAFLCAIAVKSLVDMSFHSVRKALSVTLNKYKDDKEVHLASFKLDYPKVFLVMFFDFIELLVIGYILFHTNLFIAVVLFSVVLANFFISWLAILCPAGYIFKRYTTRVLWVYFSLNFGFFKDVVCILSFLAYLILLT